MRKSIGARRAISSTSTSSLSSTAAVASASGYVHHEHFRYYSYQRGQHVHKNEKANLNQPQIQNLLRKILRGRQEEEEEKHQKSNYNQRQQLSAHQLQPPQGQQNARSIFSEYANKSRECLRHVANILAVVMLLLLLSLMPAVQADWLLDCGDCACKWNSGKKTANCNNLSLNAIPENLSPEVQVLDLSFNRIAYLEENAFLNAELQNLQKLYIRNSSLQQIDPKAFTQLEILIEIDLSNNKLRYLKPNQFARAIKLRYLVLNGNLIESLEDGVFQDLKYLHKIELQRNLLQQIGSSAFVDLPLLSHIYLDNNKFTLLRKDSFVNLQRLNALSLDQNPWNCTCELQVFRDFVIKRNLYTPPTSCFYPPKLRGMLWIEDQPEAFACKPKIIFPAKSAAITSTKENVSLSCRILTSPQTQINWDFNRKILRLQQPPGERYQIQLFKDEEATEKDFGREVFVSRLTIYNANQHDDEGIYTCLAENPAGKDSVQLSLVLQNPNQPASTWLIQSSLWWVITLMALCLVGISILMAMITFCIYKRFKANTNNDNNNGNGNNIHHITRSGEGSVAASGTGISRQQALNVRQQEMTSNSADIAHTQVFCGNEVSLCVNSVSNQRDAKPPQLPPPPAATAISNQQPIYQHLHQFHHEHQQQILAQHHQHQNEQYQQLQYSGSMQQHLNEINIADGRLHNVKSTATPNTNTNTSNARISNIANQHFDSISIQQQQQQHEHRIGSQRIANAANADHANTEEQSQEELPNQHSRTMASKSLEYQPDLVLSQKSNPKSEDQNSQKSSLAARNKYNSKVQEYLMAKYGTIKGKAQTKNNNKKISENIAKREAPSIPLTSASLSTATATSTATGLKKNFDLKASSPVMATQTLTLQRHTKSLAFPIKQQEKEAERESNHVSKSVLVSGTKLSALDTMRTSLKVTSTTPTDLSNPYTYRQPPPPPYKAIHRTNNSFSFSNIHLESSESNEMARPIPTSATIANSKSLQMNITTATTTTTAAAAATKAMKATLATNSVNFLTANENKLPESQLL